MKQGNKAFQRTANPEELKRLQSAMDGIKVWIHA